MLVEANRTPALVRWRFSLLTKVRRPSSKLYCSKSSFPIGGSTVALTRGNRGGCKPVYALRLPDRALLLELLPTYQTIYYLFITFTLFGTFIQVMVMVITEILITPYNHRKILNHAINRRNGLTQSE